MWGHVGLIDYHHESWDQGPIPAMWADRKKCSIDISQVKGTLCHNWAFMVYIIFILCRKSKTLDSIPIKYNCSGRGAGKHMMAWVLIYELVSLSMYLCDSSCLPLYTSPMPIYCVQHMLGWRLQHCIYSVWMSVLTIFHLSAYSFLSFPPLSCLCLSLPIYQHEAKSDKTGHINT